MKMLSSLLVTVIAGSMLSAVARDLQRVPLGDAEVGFTIHLGVPKIAGMDVIAKEMGQFFVTTNGDTHVAMWKGHPACGAGFTVTATFTKQGEGWTYSFAYAGLEGVLEVESVAFPELTVPHTPQAGVLYARAHGMGLVRRPDWKKLPFGEPIDEANPKAFKFAAVLDEAATSWYLDARDTQRWSKTVFAKKGDWEGTKATIGFQWLAPADGARAGRLPWEGLITSFKGSWYEAAMIYRPWARSQPGYKAAAARRRGKLRDIAFWAWNRGKSDRVIPPIERFAKDSGVPVALDWYWWHRPSYDTGYPNFWPPREGEESFRRAVARLRKGGIYVMTYLNGLSWDQDDPSWAEGGEASVIMNHDVEYAGIPFNVYTKHRLARMCGEAPLFQRRIEEQVSILAAAGLDGVYLDQISCGTRGGCWNPAHSHVKGGGHYIVDGYRDYVGRVRAANPDIDLSSEECSEDFMDVFDSFISLFGPTYERCGVGALPECEAVPVWNAIYHGAVTCFGTYSLLGGIPPWDDLWPSAERWKEERDWLALFPDQFAIEFARGTVWGNQPSVHNLLMEHATDAKYEREWRFMVETARFYHANRDFLYDGEMLAPGTLDCQREDADFMIRGIYSKNGSYRAVHERGLPSVFHNVWRAPDGRVAAILVNWTRGSRRYRLDCPAGAAEGELPARSWRLERLEGAR